MGERPTGWCWTGVMLIVVLALAPTDPTITGESLPPPARRVLAEVMVKSDVSSAHVTSTSRTPREQMRAMHGFIRRHGTKAAYQLYGPEGDAVIAAYERAVARDTVAPERAMFAELQRQLPAAHRHDRLMHTKSTHYVFDISISSVASDRRDAFVRTARDHPRVTRFLGPRDGEKGAYHFEIPRRSKSEASENR